MKNFFKAKGIIHESSSPYTPEQNGNAEREIKTIVESARTMLIESGLPETFWTEAMNTAVYTLNRRPCKPGFATTAFEKWFERKPILAEN